MPFFFRDSSTSSTISWETLVEELNSSVKFNPYCNSSNYYDIFKTIIISILFGKEIILLDSDFSDAELLKLTGNSNFDSYSETLQISDDKKIIDKDELINKLKSPNKNWKVTLYTSGTTGIPKKVTHTFDSITRFTRISQKTSNWVWGFAYNPTHMAGFQVLLQALLNGNSLIRLFGFTPMKIHEEIEKNQITHISATPTFYRLLLPCNKIFPSVTRITSGGEKFNSQTIVQLENIFPNSKITNIYASTEAGAIFASNNEIFTLKDEFKTLIKIDNNELLIHHTLMGFSDETNKDWFHTGDLVEVKSDNPLKFKFLSRKSDLINVGGYNVNPIEVEEFILQLRDINEVKVFAKSNSVLGNIICCDIIRENENIDELQVREFLQTKIQEFKIPRVIKFVKEISTTRTGKLKRT